MIQYRVKEITTPVFNLLEKSKEEFFSIDQEDLFLNQSSSIGLIAEQNYIFAEIHIVFKSKDEELIRFVCKTMFEFVHLEDFKKEEDVWDIPDKLAEKLIEASIDHARALLNMKLNNTVYKGSVMVPIFDKNLLG